MRFPLALGVACLVVATPALADRIDGEWCHQSGSLVIDGPKIRTPSGNNATGDYSHHNFAYKVPPTEPEPGSDIAMRQLNEETMVLTRKGKPEETWRRCKVTS
jgi:hypothetical protein